MQALQPMQTSLSRSTMPSGRLCRAVTGQIVTHGAAVHWLQRSTAKWRRTAGKLPTSVYFTQVRKSPSGTSFSDLQATVQAWQPMQRRWSRTKPYCMRGGTGGGAP
jgi:pectin methylesterase-like acyl-CoA thioesterase